MATNVFGGREASVLVSGTSTGTGANIGAIRNWRIAFSADPIDATSNDSSGWMERISGIRSVEVTAETLVLSTSATHEQDTLRSALSSGLRQWFQVINSTTSTGPQTYRGYGFVSGWEQGASFDDIQLHNFSIAGDGAWAEV